MSDETIQESIDDLRKKVTVIVACAQMLQRHGDEAPELVEKRAAMIEAAATDMSKTLRHLEDVSSTERD